MEGNAEVDIADFKYLEVTARSESNDTESYGVASIIAAAHGWER